MDHTKFEKHSNLSTSLNFTQSKSKITPFSLYQIKKIVILGISSSAIFTIPSILPLPGFIYLNYIQTLHNPNIVFNLL